MAGRFPHLTLVLTDAADGPAGLVDYFTVGLLNVVSSKLPAVLEEVGAEIEYFPVTVLYHGDATASEYFVANPLRRLDAIDHQQSVVELDEEMGDALAVTKLVLDEARLKDVRMAVIAEIQRIGVQDDVAAAIEAAGCIGCAFVDPISIRY
ncbi:imm11 family protein [Massilia sp. Leaf139]|uniref:imm11 family protein n=1 Tax=Massilia sp. Leaf139 TaxID=1736272 RepID=UPI0012E76C10|nr:DUF1629 domain-containing protein [Massilia sp. Leaf139]